MTDEVALTEPPRDVLGPADREPGTSSSTGRHRLLAGLALILVVLGAVVDRALADRERTALLTAVRGGEGALSAARDSQLSLAQYAGPLLTGADVPAAARRSAFATLAQDAARWEPRVREQQVEVAELAVLPWHGELRAAREAYAARLGVWADVLAEVEQEPEVLAEVLDDDVRDTREQAAGALVAAGLDPAEVRSALAGGAVAGEAG